MTSVIPQPRPLLMMVVALCAAAHSFAAQVFDQSFTSSTSVSSYVKVQSPSTGQFNNISAATNGGAWSIADGRLQLDRTGVLSDIGAGLARTTSFSGSPTVLAVKFTLGVTANSWQTDALTLDIGKITGTSAFNYANATASSSTFARLHVDLFGGGDLQFKLSGSSVGRSVTFDSDGTLYPVSCYLNKTSTTRTYLAPDGTARTLGANRVDLWVGTSLEIDEHPALNGSNSNLNNLRLRLAGADNGVWRIDDINVDNALPAPPVAPVAGSIVTHPAYFTFAAASQQGTSSVVPVTGQSFAEAWRVTATPGAQPAAANVTVAAATTSAVAKGEALIATFHYRGIDTDADELNVTACFKAAGSSGARSLTLPLRGRQQWRKVSVPFIAAADYAAGAAALEFHLGARAQTVEIGGVALSRHGQRSVFAQMASPPSPTDAITKFAFHGEGTFALKTETDAVGHPLFAKIRNVTVKTGVVPPPAPHQVRHLALVPQAVNAGDTLVAIFWARNAGSDPAATTLAGYSIAQVASPYESVRGFDQLFLGSEWTQHIIPVRSAKSWAANTLQFSVKNGAIPGQVIEVAGLQLLNLGADALAADLYNTELVYPGREIASAWRNEAEDRIETLRKGDLVLNLKGADGLPLDGASLNATLHKHRFGFGSAITSYRLMGAIKDTADSVRYRSEIAALFNKAVLESEMKWFFWDNPDMHGFSGQKRAVDSLRWLRENGIFDIRGHTLLWPDWDRCWGPDVLASLSPVVPKTIAEVEAAIAAHIESSDRTIGSAAHPDIRSFISEWDVVNEPFLKYQVTDYLTGLDSGASGMDPPTRDRHFDHVPADAEVIASWFDGAKRADPVAKRYLNETAPSTNYLSAFPCDNYTKALTARLLHAEVNAPINGVGFQSHMEEQFLLPPAQAKALFDSFDSRLKLQVTEYDHRSTDQVLQADYLADYMTLVFSLPSFATFVLWGFWDGAHWNDNAPIFNFDWSVKPSGEAWLALVHNKWKTSESRTTGASGSAVVRGFLGRYAVTATHGGITKTYYATLPATTGATLDLKLAGASGTTVWLHEAEHGVVYPELALQTDATASSGAYLVGATTKSTAPATDETAQLRIDTEASGTVNIWLRVLATSGTTDSYWMRPEGSSAWLAVNVGYGATWRWVKATGAAITLPATTGNALYFSTREAGCKLDQILITNDLAFVP